MQRCKQRVNGANDATSCDPPGKLLRTLTLSAGTMLSLAMACRRRGAPVKLCSPAPQVEKKEPITMTHGDGQANVPITKFPWTPSPNLVETGEGRLKGTLDITPVMEDVPATSGLTCL